MSDHTSNLSTEQKLQQIIDDTQLRWCDLRSNQNPSEKVKIDTYKEIRKNITKANELIDNLKEELAVIENQKTKTISPAKTADIKRYNDLLEFDDHLKIDEVVKIINSLKHVRDSMPKELEVHHGTQDDAYEEYVDEEKDAF
jgi:hypothetical protein